MFAGDTLDYDFAFKTAAGDPINIQGMILTFTMKINKSDRDGLDNGLQTSVTFPVSLESANGEGEMYVNASDTAKLEPDRWYQFDFSLASGDHRYTVGTGKIFVKQKVKTA